MKINRAKLIELLVEKTGMDADEIESQLKQLIDRILDAAERGKALEVKEFGMFYFDENGDLKFDPSDELSTEINFKYAGMEPVELKPARDQDSDAQANDLSYEDKADETEEESVSSTGSDMDEIFGFNVGDQDLEEEDEGPIEDDAEGPDGGALISPPDKVDRDIDPFSGLLGDASSKMKGSDAEEKDEDADKEDPFSFISEDYEEQESAEDDDTGKDEELEPIPGLGKEEEEDEDFETEPSFTLDDEEEDSDDLSKIFDEPKPQSEPEPDISDSEEEPEVVAAKAVEDKRDTKSKISREKSEQRDPITMVISIGLIIILIVIGFLVIPSLFDSDDSGNEMVTDPTEEQVESTPEGQVDPTPEENQQDDTPVEPEAETEVTEEEPVQPEPEQPVYGLMGDLVDEANDGYSIVLHSMQSEVRARSEAEDLASEGYRVLVSPRLVQGSTVWRVSVGQFSTISEAQQAAAELPDPYSSNNFIQRIQTN